MLLDLLTSANVIKSTRYMSLGDISVGFNSLLICFEMIIFAILHLFAFTWREYDRGPHKKTPIFAAFLDAFNPWDIVRATARGTRWLLCGVNRRQTEAEYVLKRQKSESEASRLVENAAELAGRESPQPMTDDSLAIRHPAPSDRADEVNTLKVQTGAHGSYHPESVEMINTPLQPGRQRPHAPHSPYSQQVANNGYGHSIAPPPQGPNVYHERYRDQTPSPVGRQEHLAYPTSNYMPSTPGQGGTPAEYLHSPTSPVVAGSHSPMLPIVGGQAGGGQQQHQQHQQEYTAWNPSQV